MDPDKEYFGTSTTVPFGGGLTVTTFDEDAAPP